MGGVKVEMTPKDQKPPINKTISFAKFVSCPKGLKTFGKKCKAMILPDGKSCDEV